jgi:hypothetical protein
MQVRVLDPGEQGAWDAFVNREGGSFFHYFGWKALYEERGFTYVPLVLEDGDESTIGIFPIVVRDRRLYRTIESLPEGASGGYILSRALAPEQRGLAVSAFAAFIDTHISSNCSVFRLKTNVTLDPGSAEQHHQLVARHGFCPVRQQEIGFPCTHLLPLEEPFEKEVWPKWAPNVRKRIRRAGEADVRVIVDRRLEYLEDFTAMLAHLFRRHNSVPLGRREVEMRLRTFEGRTKVFVALIDARPVAAQLCYYTPTTCFLSKMPACPEAYRRNITMLLYATAIRDACENGCRYVEFGVTNDARNEAYKAHFRGTRIQLGYYEKTYSPLHRCVQYVGDVSKALWSRRFDLSRMINRRV